MCLKQYSSSYPSLSGGFTLIELLIVVAIIAILSAIAVPNFLEAQVRAKTSKAMSDMRTTKTGLESYAVDWNQYPRGLVTIKIMGPYNFMTAGLYVDDDNVSNNWELKTLTTPVAYLTSVYPDPFHTEPGVSQMNFEYQNQKEYYKVMQDKGYSGTYSYIWELRSHGPDRDRDAGMGISNYVEQIYDATNGTISSGDILMTERGFVNNASSGRKSQ